MQLCLFEDRAENFEPISLTRPIFDLLCGLTSLGSKHRELFAGTELAMLIRPDLEDLVRAQRPAVHVNDPSVCQQRPTVLVNGRWLPPASLPPLPKPPFVALCHGEPAFGYLPGETPVGEVAQWLRTRSLEVPTLTVGGTMLNYPWDLVDSNADAIRRDFEHWRRRERCTRMNIALIGDADLLWVSPSARIEPMVVADTSAGPVVIDEHAVVSAFTRLEGPCYVGPRTQVMGAKIRAGTSLGPQCRIGGEVEASIVHGYSNKYHEGFLGHAYLGEWVNLGAGTHNSDLRNDYGQVKVVMNGLPLHTGRSKVGCFLGDHTKTGLGALLNTGTNVGIFCNLLPAGRLAPKYMPSFTTWWNGAVQEAFTLDQLLQTAEIVMQRRGQTLTDEHRHLYGWLWQRTAQERRRVREDEIGLRRKTA